MLFGGVVDRLFIGRGRSNWPNVDCRGALRTLADLVFDFFARLEPRGAIRYSPLDATLVHIDAVPAAVGLNPAVSVAPGPYFDRTCSHRKPSVRRLETGHQRPVRDRSTSRTPVRRLTRPRQWSEDGERPPQPANRTTLRVIDHRALGFDGLL